MNIHRYFVCLALGTLILSSNPTWADTVLEAKALFNTTRISTLHQILWKESIDHNIRPTWDGTIVKTVMIDDQVRYIGGNNLSEVRDGQVHKIWPTLKFPFTLTKQWGKIQPVLVIGSLKGLNLEQGQKPCDY